MVSYKNKKSDFSFISVQENTFPSPLAQNVLPPHFSGYSQSEKIVRTPQGLQRSLDRKIKHTDDQQLIEHRHMMFT